MLSQSVTDKKCNNSLTAVQLVDDWCNEIKMYSEIKTKVKSALNGIKNAFVETENLYHLKSEYRRDFEQGLTEQIQSYLD